MDGSVRQIFAKSGDRYFGKFDTASYSLKTAAPFTHRVATSTVENFAGKAGASSLEAHTHGIEYKQAAGWLALFNVGGGKKGGRFRMPNRFWRKLGKKLFLRRTKC